jgi:hypothetical protein
MLTLSRSTTGFLRALRPVRASRSQFIRVCCQTFLRTVMPDKVQQSSAPASGSVVSGIYGNPRARALSEFCKWVWGSAAGRECLACFYGPGRTRHRATFAACQLRAQGRRRAMDRSTSLGNAHATRPWQTLAAMAQGDIGSARVSGVGLPEMIATTGMTVCGTLVPGTT